MSASPDEFIAMQELEMAARILDVVLPLEPRPEEKDCPTCHGEGEVEVGTVQDMYGNWDTETYRCPDCGDHVS